VIQEDSADLHVVIPRGGMERRAAIESLSVDIDSERKKELDEFRMPLAGSQLQRCGFVYTLHLGIGAMV
jgi:hypothetical protein